MGGSYPDSGCRMTWTVVSLTAFTYYAFYAATTEREEKELLDCFSRDGIKEPLSEDDPMIDDSDTYDISYHWKLLFYAHIGLSVLTII